MKLGSRQGALLKLVGLPLLLAACANVIGLDDYETDASLDRGGAANGGQTGEGGDDSSAGGRRAQGGEDEGGAPPVGGSNAGTSSSGGSGGSGSGGSGGSANGGTAPGGASNGGGGTQNGGTSNGGSGGSSGTANAGSSGGGTGPVACGPDLLQNGNFDGDPSLWIEVAPDDSIIVSDPYAHSGGYSAELGPDDLANPIGTSNDLYQSLMIPSNATELTVSGYYQIYEAFDDTDVISLDLYDADFYYLDTFHDFYADADVLDWTYFSYSLDVTPYQGTQVWFDFIGFTSAFFYFDTVSLTVTGCAAP